MSSIDFRRRRIDRLYAGLEPKTRAAILMRAAHTEAEPPWFIREGLRGRDIEEFERLARLVARLQSVVLPRAGALQQQVRMLSLQAETLRILAAWGLDHARPANRTTRRNAPDHSAPSRPSRVLPELGGAPTFNEGNPWDAMMILIASKLPVHVKEVSDELQALAHVTDRVTAELDVDDAAHPVLRTLLESMEAELEDIVHFLEGFLHTSTLLIPNEEATMRLWALLQA